MSSGSSSPASRVESARSLNMTVRCRRWPGLSGLAAALFVPFYQGLYLKGARFVSYSAEILFASSQYDDFVPPRVRRALLGVKG